MDTQESDDPNASRKTSIERLSKEELVKKYRAAILIAQKAKESKAEYLKHLSQHESASKMLEEKLADSEKQKKIEAELRAQVEEELRNARELINSMRGARNRKNDNSVMVTDSGCEQENEFKSNQDLENFPERSDSQKNDTSVQADEYFNEKGEHSHINSALSFELDECKLTITNQATEICNMKRELNAFNDLRYQLETLLTEKEKEINSLQECISSNEDASKKCQSELECKLHQLEESTKIERNLLNERNTKSEKIIKDLEDLLQSKEDFIQKQELSLHEMKSSLEEVQKEISEKQNYIIESEKKITALGSEVEQCRDSFRDQSNDNNTDLWTSKISDLEKEIIVKEEEICLKNEEITQLSSNLNDTKSNFENLKHSFAELSSKTESFERESNALSLEVLSLEKEKLELVSQIEELRKTHRNENQDDLVKELKEENEELQHKVLKKNEEIKTNETTIAELSLQLKEIKTSVDGLILSASESAAKIESLTAENICAVQKVEALEAENLDLRNRNAECLQQQNSTLLELKAELKVTQDNLLVKENLLDKGNETISHLESEILTLKEQQQNLGVSFDEYTELQRNLEQRDQEILEEGKTVKRLNKELEKLRSDNECLMEQVSNLTQHLEDAKVLVKKSEGEVFELRSNISSANELYQRLSDKLQSLQNTLELKESLIQDLEQEVSRLKDIAAHESTNTEVSSTFSLSRAEELSRMKDLEDSFEDKYTKLRVVAVKLKKRVNDLTQTLESERSKMVTEKSDLQAKVAQLASHGKTVQTLQGEVDRLQDLLEDQKKVQIQLTKDLESAVKDAASCKVDLASAREEILRVANEKKGLESKISDLSATLSNSDGLRDEVEKLSMQLKERDSLLQDLREENHSLAEQLEKVCADAKKKSVLSLEMADMEKSVSELNRQLSSERETLKKTVEELEQERSSSLTWEKKTKELEDKVAMQEARHQELKVTLKSMKEEADNLQSKYKEKETAVEQLSIQLEKQRSKVEELNLHCSELLAKQLQTKENARQQLETLGRQVFQLEEQCTSLKEANKGLEEELVSVRTNFENYKVRAQSVLRQSNKQEDRLVSSSAVHNAEELEVEVERLRVNISNLNANVKQTTLQLEAALQEVSVEREEKLHAIKQAQALRETSAQAIERQHAAEERLTMIIEESKQAKLHADTLVQCYKQQLEDLKTAHQKRVASLTEQLENLQESITHASVTNADYDKASSVTSNASPVVDWAAQIPSVSPPDPDVALRLSSLQREEGEGSESVESFPSRRISVTTQDRRHELIPLDKLLASPSYPEADIRDESRADLSDVSVELLQSKLSACESRAAHLTALLSEAESDAARLTQLNEVLKEEIRRQQRSEERAQHAHNLEYLKNIVVKFITLQSGDERQRLVPVLNTILKLSPEEAGLVATVAKGSSQVSGNARGWGSYLPLPGWSGS